MVVLKDTNTSFRLEMVTARHRAAALSTLMTLRSMNTSNNGTNLAPARNNNKKMAKMARQRTCGRATTARLPPGPDSA